MPTTANLTMLYFDMTGGTIVHGHGGTLIFTPLTISGSAYTHWSGAVTLPSITASGSASFNPTGSGAVRLPSVLAVGYCGGTGDITLPSVTAAGAISIPNIGRGAITLPSVRASGHALAGYAAHGAIRLPSVLASGKCGARGAVTLPSVRATGAGRTDLHASGAIRLPSVRASGTGTLFANAWRGAIILPSLRVVARLLGNIVLPSVIASGHAVNGTVATQRSWAFNIHTGTVTEFPAFFFVRFFRWNNKHYGIGQNGGLYLLAGDTDAGAPIPWAFETGLDDMDSPAMKGIKGVYISGFIEAGAELTIIDDKKQRFTYRTHAPAAGDYRNYRVVTGKGIRTCNIGIAMASAVGGFFEIDNIAPKYDISKRNL